MFDRSFPTYHGMRHPGSYGKDFARPEGEHLSGYEQP
jgi:hypothetical protein